jgi:N-acetylmuramate 1-kinase
MILSNHVRSQSAPLSLSLPEPSLAAALAASPVDRESPFAQRAPQALAPGLPDDDRFATLMTWVGAMMAARDFPVVRASADASFRRYFRVTLGDRTVIAVDAPPERENVSAFIKIAQLFSGSGVHVPRILHYDLTRGFLLVSDLGLHTYLHVLNDQNADALFADATGALLKIQRSTVPGVLARYDDALFRREIELFREWYVGRHLGLTLTADQEAVWQRTSDLILKRALATPTVYVHRDFMPRNLMVSEPNPGVIDFQDAVEGPVTYDIAALMRDAFVSWEEDRVLDVTARYWQAARKSRLPVGEDFGQFYEAVEWMALQRHLKILGIFARIQYRDGKSHYLPDTPRFVRYVRATCERYRALGPLLSLMDELHATTRSTGLTF